MSDENKDDPAADVPMKWMILLAQVPCLTMRYGTLVRGKNAE